jgi:hypothetical protein
MSETVKPTIAFILSLMGGIFILVSGGMRFVMGMYDYGGMMSGYWSYGMMGEYGWGYGPAYGMMKGLGYTAGMFGLVGVLFGLVVIASSLLLYYNPSQHTGCGVVILIFSVLSIFSGVMAGFGAGLILGVLGGIFALTWKPTITKT